MVVFGRVWCREEWKPFGVYWINKIFLNISVNISFPSSMLRNKNWIFRKFKKNLVTLLKIFELPRPVFLVQFSVITKIVQKMNSVLPKLNKQLKKQQTQIASRVRFSHLLARGVGALFFWRDLTFHKNLPKQNFWIGKSF